MKFNKYYRNVVGLFYCYNLTYSIEFFDSPTVIFVNSIKIKTVELKNHREQHDSVLDSFCYIIYKIVTVEII